MPISHSTGSFISRDLVPVEGGDGAKSLYVLVSVEDDRDIDLFIRDVGNDLYVLYISLRHELEPDRLPDTCRPRVETAVVLILVGLLSAGLQRVSHVVLRVDRDDVLTLRDERGHVESERGVAAAVAPRLASVDPHRRRVVHRAEVEKDAAGELFRRQCERPSVPDGEDEIGVLHAGEL